MSIVRSAFTVSFFISISRIVGFIRDIFIAQYVGVSLLSDAFFAAFRLPNFFRRVFGEGAMNSAFVPIFVEKLQDKKTDMDEKIFMQNVFSILLYVLLIFTLLFQIFMPFLMKILFPGFAADPEKFTLLVDLSRITIFYLIFISLVALCSGILNSLGKFAVPASAPIILNATLIASLFVFGSLVPNHAYALSWGVFIAGVLQFLWLVTFTIKEGMLLYPKSFSLKLFHNADIKKFFRKLLPAVIGGNVLQINLLVDSVFASMITGAISYLYYADRINQLPLAMIGIAIGVALLPAMSRKIKAREIEGAIRLQNLALEVGLIMVIPATLALTCLAYPIIVTLFERGKFTHEESFFVAKALQFYSYGLPAYVLVKVMEPAFFSRGDTRTPMTIAVICLFSNAILNAVFFFHGFDYIGIILSSIISSYLNLTLLIAILLSKKHFYFEKRFLPKLLKILIPALLMAYSLLLMKNFFAISEVLNGIIELIIMITVGLIIYFVAAYFSGSLNILLTSGLMRKRKI